MKIKYGLAWGLCVLLSIMVFQVARAGNSAFQGSTSFGSITDGEGVQLINTSFISAPLPLSTVEGRLTLTSGTPVTTSDVTAATTIYFAPYKGDRIYLYDGTRWKLYSFAELSLALGTLTASLPYDVFIYDNAGTLTLESLAWTNGTTRATALTTLNGVLVKTGATTRRYLGTFYTTSTTTTEDSAAKRFVWNYYNRVLKSVLVLEATDSWSYTTASWRQMNANAANQIAVVQGRAEEPIWIEGSAPVTGATASFVNVRLSIGEDSTTTPLDTASKGYATIHNTYSVGTTVYTSLNIVPTEGYHYYAILELGGSGLTFYGDAGDPSLVRSGLRGLWKC